MTERLAETLTLGDIRSAVDDAHHVLRHADWHTQRDAILIARDLLAKLSHALTLAERDALKTEATGG